MAGAAEAALRAELDALLAREQLIVPPERYAGVLAVYADLRQLRSILRQPRDFESEPSNVFVIDCIVRTLGGDP